MHKIKHFLDRLFFLETDYYDVGLLIIRYTLYMPYHVHIQYIATANWKKFIHIKHIFSVLKYK